MDAYEATRVVFSRIQSLDPDNAAKIMGLLLIQDNGEKEMIRLAFGPETLLHSVILKAKKELGLSPVTSTVSASAAASATSPFHLNLNLNHHHHHHHQLSRQNSLPSPSSRFGIPPPPLTIASPSWAPPPSDAVQCPSDDLIISPNSAAANSPFYELDEPYLGWKPCLYFARGFCKNGTACKFLHDVDGGASKLDMALEQELLLRGAAKSQRLSSPTASAFPYSPTGTVPISPSSAKCMNMNMFIQQNESQRAAAAAAAAAALMLGGDEGHKFMGRSRFDRSEFLGMMNPGSRQIYLTFPADSTFREEDVSNYFSIYGPVQDVRIPYQQKRMFGFVTFVYPETVKLILAKGNPHFVCDARVLVKPYKEKGKVPDKKQQQQQGEMRGDFSGCTTPTALDGRDPYELQQLGARMMYNSCSSSQEMYLRRKLEEQQQAAELQQAIELQGRRFMGLQLLDFSTNNINRSMPFSPISTPTTITTVPSNDRSHEESPTEEKSLSPASNGGEKQAMAVNSAIAIAADKVESAERDGSPNEDSDFQGSVEHNLPDSPFASPTKAAAFGAEHPFGDGTVAVESEFVAGSSPRVNGNGNQLISPALMPQNSSLDMGSFNSCFFQMPRFSSGHGAVGLYK